MAEFDNPDKSGPIDAETESEFVMTFVEEADLPRKDFLPIFQETLANYLVQPITESTAGRKNFPFADIAPAHNAQFSRLKDSESHQVVETLLAQIMLSVFPEVGFIKTRRRGIEDAFSAGTVSRLLEYCLGLEGHYRVIYQWLKDTFIFGTGIIEAAWDFVESPVLERGVSVVGGVEISEFSRTRQSTWDDPRISNVDLMDFFPDPGQPIMSKMLGAAKRFKTTARSAKNNPTFDQDAVRRAIKNAMRDDFREEEDSDWRESLDRPREHDHHPDFVPLVGFEYWGEVPWKPKAGGDRWRVITVLGGERVRSIDYPLARRRLPWHDFTVNPIAGRFYGLSPLEVSRFDQDLADTIKMMLADAVVRMTHPPHIVNRYGDVDTAALQAFRPNVLVKANDVNAVAQVQYNPPLQPAAALLDQTKGSIRERTGATDIVQGLPSSTKRLSATEFAGQSQQANSRPELIAQYVEKEVLPPLGAALLSLYQQFIEDDPEELSSRVGKKPENIPLSAILGEHDLQFTGSRLVHNNQSRLTAMERASAVFSSNPVLLTMMPWEEWAKKYLHALDLNELEAFVAAPDTMEVQFMIQKLLAGGPNSTGNNNQVQERQTASGALPAQISGQTVG